MLAGLKQFESAILCETFILSISRPLEIFYKMLKELVNSSINSRQDSATVNTAVKLLTL